MKTDVFGILRKRYPESEYALMQEVSNDAGFNRSRSADYIVMNLWPSRGLALMGFEQKASRSDWLSELKKPEKAESIFKYCDYWYLITTEEGIAKLEEIPETWGWVCIKGGKIHTMKDAPKLTPEPISRGMMAAMLKRASTKQGYVREVDIEDRIKSAREKGKEDGERNVRHQLENLKNLNQNVQDYKSVTGIDLTLNAWRADAKNIGEAVNFINSGGAEQILKDLLKLEKTAKFISESIENGLTKIKEAEEQAANPLPQ